MHHKHFFSQIKAINFFQHLSSNIFGQEVFFRTSAMGHSRSFVVFGRSLPTRLIKSPFAVWIGHKITAGAASKSKCVAIWRRICSANDPIMSYHLFSQVLLYLLGSLLKFVGTFICGIVGRKFCWFFLIYCHFWINKSIWVLRLRFDCFDFGDLWWGVEAICRSLFSDRILFLWYLIDLTVA